jgi:hypothetical protein
MGNSGCELTGKEAVELDKHLEVDIVALGSPAVRVPHVVTVEIDTCLTKQNPRQPCDLVCSIWLSKLEGQISRRAVDRHRNATGS